MPPSKAKASKEFPVLVVNRLATMRHLTLSALGQAGFRNLTQVKNPDEVEAAIASIGTQNLSLVLELNDVENTDGELNMLRKLRTREETADMPVVVTALVVVSRMVRVFGALGIKFFLLKTLDLDRLAVKLEEVLIRERRRFLRRRPAGEFRVDEGSGRGELGVLTGISWRGMRIRSNQPLRPGDSYRLSITLAKPLSNEPEMTLPCRCFWCLPDDRAGHWRCGLVWDAVYGKRADLLAQFMESKCLDPWDPPGGGDGDERPGQM